MSGECSGADGSAQPLRPLSISALAPDCSLKETEVHSSSEARQEPPSLEVIICASEACPLGG